MIAHATATADVRLDMLEEAVDIIRQLLSGDRVDHHGTHYIVEDARISSCPDEIPPILVSAFGDKALSLAARIADGFVTTQPATDDLASYRRQGGRGPGSAGAKVCYGESRDDTVALAHRLWPNIGLPGELAQVLPSPQGEYVDAGFDELFISQIGPHSEEFFRAYEKEVLPALRQRAERR